MAGTKRGRGGEKERERERRERGTFLSSPFPFFLPPNPLTLLTPATQANWELTTYPFFLFCKTTDVRLQESQERMMAYDRRSSEQTKLISELTQKVQNVLILKS